MAAHTLRRAIARAFFDNLTADLSLGYDGALRTVSALLHHSHSGTTERYIGLQSERQRRDRSLRGKPFLSAMVSDPGSVIPIRPALDN